MPDRRMMNQPETCHSQMDRLRSRSDFQELADGSPEEYVMLRLRLRKGLSEKDYREKFQSEIPESYRKNARRLAPSGLVQEDCEGIRLTRRGFLVSNYLIGEILWHS